jgi:hypothetical protein
VIGKRRVPAPPARIIPFIFTFPVAVLLSRNKVKFTVYQLLSWDNSIKFKLEQFIEIAKYAHSL